MKSSSEKNREIPFGDFTVKNVTTAYSKRDPTIFSSKKTFSLILFCKLLYYLFLAGKLPIFLLFNKKHPKLAMTEFDLKVLEHQVKI